MALAEGLPGVLARPCRRRPERPLRAVRFPLRPQRAAELELRVTVDRVLGRRVLEHLGVRLLGEPELRRIRPGLAEEQLAEREVRVRDWPRGGPVLDELEVRPARVVEVAQALGLQRGEVPRLVGQPRLPGSVVVAASAQTSGRSAAKAAYSRTAFLRALSATSGLSPDAAASSAYAPASFSVTRGHSGSPLGRAARCASSVWISGTSTCRLRGSRAKTADSRPASSGSGVEGTRRGAGGAGTGAGSFAAGVGAASTITGSEAAGAHAARTRRTATGGAKRMGSNEDTRARQSRSRPGLGMLWGRGSAAPSTTPARCRAVRRRPRAWYRGVDGSRLALCTSPVQRTAAAGRMVGQRLRASPSPTWTSAWSCPRRASRSSTERSSTCPPRTSRTGRALEDLRRSSRRTRSPRYSAAVDMLTRTSAKNDLAPDASVFPAARDPETGGRRLEELAFEVVSTETLSHAAKKARALVGARRPARLRDRRRAAARARVVEAHGHVGDPPAATARSSTRRWCARWPSARSRRR